MSQLPYDITSPVSILEYARRLSGKTLAEAVDLNDVKENLQNKGDLGSMVERYYFQHTPPNNHDPDFAEAGVELKTTGVKKDSSGQFKAKERLVLSMINYMSLVHERWEENSLMEKCQLMLLLFYLFEKGVPVYDRRFVFDPLLWEFPASDMKIIERDWRTIKNTIRNGKAHELSEGDTFYLGACRKGPGGSNEPLRKQPYSEIGAKARAFSLKPSYMNTILNGYARKSELFSGTYDIESGIEVITSRKFAAYLNMPVDEIGLRFGLIKNGANDKAYFRNLTLRIIGTKGRFIPEFEKAGIELKTIRLRNDGIPKEDMSFPSFSYMDIVNEDWEDSSLFKKLEQKFFFVIFKYDVDEILRLHDVKYWNMPYIDREEAQKVWELTKYRIANGEAENLPKMTENRVAHVRPHARNRNDVIPTPQGKMLVKKCFWLNRGYIAEQVVRRISSS